MKSNIIFAVMLCMGLTPQAVGAGSCTTYTITDYDPCEHISQDNCNAESTERCYSRSDGTCSCITSCITCDSGYTKVTKTLEGCTGITYNICECNCGNCTSDTDWSAGNTGYQKKTTRTCECYAGTAACQESTEYRCAIGYYGSSTNGTSGCTRCPASGGTYGTTANAGATSITSCYLPSGTSFCDSTGCGIIDNDKCYYKQ